MKIIRKRSFNPYRVFFSIVTKIYSQGYNLVLGFNPYRVFFSIVTSLKFP